MKKRIARQLCGLLRAENTIMLKCSETSRGILNDRAYPGEGTGKGDNYRK